MKKCSICKGIKEDSMFRKQTKSKDGLKSYCRPCDSAKIKESYLKNREKRLLQIRQWRDNNPQKVRSYYKTIADNTPLPELQIPDNS
jgi:hypothetical protein